MSYTVYNGVSIPTAPNPAAGQTNLNYGSLVNAWIQQSPSGSAADNITSLSSIPGPVLAVKYHVAYDKVLEDAVLGLSNVTTVPRLDYRDTIDLKDFSRDKLEYTGAATPGAYLSIKQKLLLGTCGWNRNLRKYDYYDIVDTSNYFVIGNVARISDDNRDAPSYLVVKNGDGIWWDSCNDKWVLANANDKIMALNNRMRTAVDTLDETIQAAATRFKVLDSFVKFIQNSAGLSFGDEGSITDFSAALETFGWPLAYPLNDSDVAPVTAVDIDNSLINPLEAISFRISGIPKVNGLLTYVPGEWRFSYFVNTPVSGAKYEDGYVYASVHGSNSESYILSTVETPCYPETNTFDIGDVNDFFYNTADKSGHDILDIFWQFTKCGKTYKSMPIPINVNITKVDLLNLPGEFNGDKLYTVDLSSATTLNGSLNDGAFSMVLSSVYSVTQDPGSITVKAYQWSHTTIVDSFDFMTPPSGTALSNCSAYTWTANTTYSDLSADAGVYGNWASINTRVIANPDSYNFFTFRMYFPGTGGQEWESDDSLRVRFTNPYVAP